MLTKDVFGMEARVLESLKQSGHVTISIDGGDICNVLALTPRPLMIKSVNFNHIKAGASNHLLLVERVANWLEQNDVRVKGIISDN